MWMTMPYRRRCEYPQKWSALDQARMPKYESDPAEVPQFEMGSS